MNPHQLRVAILGSAQPAGRWAAALEGSGAVPVALDGRPADVAALVVAPGAKDPFARAKEALLAGVPVLYAAPFLLSPWQAALLEALSRRQRTLLRVAEPFRYLGGFRFLQRITRGREPLWRLRYLRSTSLLPEGGGRIDELAIEDLALCQALAGGPPASVMATAAQRDEIGDVCAVFVTVHYRNGPAVQCTISLAEATAARQLVAVTANHTVLLDRLDGSAPLQIARRRARSAAPPAKRSISAPGGDPVAGETQKFLEEVRAGGRSSGNGARWVQVAALWWAARQSFSFGGAVAVPTPAVSLAQRTPPPLRVIEGGGRLTQTVQRPPLTLVAS